MRRLGQVLHISSDGNLILKTNGPTKIGAKVINEHMNEVGVILDIFGPVKSPYISVKPELADVKKLVGKDLFIFQRRKKGRRKRRR